MKLAVSRYVATTCYLHLGCSGCELRSARQLHALRDALRQNHIRIAGSELLRWLIALSQTAFVGSLDVQSSGLKIIVRVR